jgi:chromosome segregation ATPase
MIEAYKAKIKDLELVIDVLKAELVNKLNMSAQEVNQLILYKTISGPLRFRPLTREELENKITDLERQLKRANQLAVQAQQSAAAAGPASDNRSVTGSVTGSLKKGTGGAVTSGPAPSKVPSSGYSRPGTASGPSSGMGAPPASLMTNKAFTSTGPSRIEDITQIANLSHEVSSLKGALSASQVTIDNQKEEISKLKMRVSELCVIEEDSEFQERQYKELKIAHDSLSDEFNEVTIQLSRAVNENVQLRSRIEIEAEQNDIDRDAMAEQCDRFLRQNSLLLQKLADMEAEMDKRILPADSSGNRRLSKSGSTDLPVNTGVINQLEAKVAKLSEKLKAADAQVIFLNKTIRYDCLTD